MPALAPLPEAGPAPQVEDQGRQVAGPAQQLQPAGLTHPLLLLVLVHLALRIHQEGGLHQQVQGLKEQVRWALDLRAFYGIVHLFTCHV